MEDSERPSVGKCERMHCRLTVRTRTNRYRKNPGCRRENKSYPASRHSTLRYLRRMCIKIYATPGRPGVGPESESDRDRDSESQTQAQAQARSPACLIASACLARSVTEPRSHDGGSVTELASDSEVRACRCAAGRCSHRDSCSQEIIRGQLHYDKLFCVACGLI